ncbi:hypothetical protein EDD18DRAFT_1115201 [Armillaria luteobubalina]|uniref:Uncharacterized protein n=1 Tax=Armillaria luteobubalina TaxID=153913 RepID=A0AA39P3N8_9AGAR|nr:hypothetical protein EDD18DRAFT_1115201 [Armillaria luteobubalina]
MFGGPACPHPLALPPILLGLSFLPKASQSTTVHVLHPTNPLQSLCLSSSLSTSTSVVQRVVIVGEVVVKGKERSSTATQSQYWDTLLLILIISGYMGTILPLHIAMLSQAVQELIDNQYNPLYY